MGGMDNLFIKYFENQEFCLALAERTTSFIKMVIKKAIESGEDAILLKGDLASQLTSLMFPSHYRKFIKPFQEEIVFFAHKKSIPVIKHSDGNLWNLLDDLIEVGFDGLHPI